MADSSLMQPVILKMKIPHSVDMNTDDVTMMQSGYASAVMTSYKRSSARRGGRHQHVLSVQW